MSDTPVQKKSLIRRFFGGLWSVIVNLYRGFVIVGFLLLLYSLYMAFTGGAAKHVENTLPTSRFRETTMLGPEGWTFQSLTVLSLLPVARKPGMAGLTSKLFTASSCACR